jgi:polysaccharide pyruvyl transferase WcaK-like protein
MESLIQNLNYWKNFYFGYIKAKVKSIPAVNKYGFESIGILNPSIGTSNLGDHIIFDAVYKELRHLFKDGIITQFPTQINTTFDAMLLMAQNDLLVISGTNLLSSNLDSKNQWKIHKGHQRFLKNKVILMGCGWWQYQGNVNRYTKNIYQSILSNEALHSVRDSYTEQKLKSIGINNVVNTSCPTLWEMIPEKCSQIPKTRADDVITTLTFYHRNAYLDKKMLDILSANYNKVYLWIQGLGDINYFQSINNGFKNIEFIPPTIEAYNEILKRKNVEYIGTRLHAGIRALQNNKRTLILSVDNRAIEIAKDVNLNVVQRENVEEVVDYIKNSYTTDIHLPQDNIDLWKKSLV